MFDYSGKCDHLPRVTIYPKFPYIEIHEHEYL